MKAQLQCRCRCRRHGPPLSHAWDYGRTRTQLPPVPYHVIAILLSVVVVVIICFLFFFNTALSCPKHLTAWDCNTPQIIESTVYC